MNREMHQDFSVNARVPPKSASERLENTSSAALYVNRKGKLKHRAVKTRLFSDYTFHRGCIPFGSVNAKLRNNIAFYGKIVNPLYQNRSQSF